jgi:hypothetical protein
MMTHKAQRTDRKRNRRRRDRGSALLVSLMVMVGLSLLGLSFVAISETENAISVNERNKAQTAALAEAGAKAIVQWFQDPSTADKRDLLPDNLEEFKTLRTVSAYKGFYKDPDDLLFDTPFGPLEKNMLFGDEEHADVRIIDGASTAATDFIKKFNDSMFFNTEAGRVVAIRVYAPPNVGGALVNGFWVAGQRYGVATIAVTAEKRNQANAVVSQSICRLVLAPFPLPGPSGAIQAIGSIDTNGAYEVHWGAIESEDTDAPTYIKRESTSFPWFDAYDRPYIEYGLDSSVVYEPKKNYAAWAHADHGIIVRPTDPAIAALHEYRIIAATGPAPDPEPDWSQAFTPGATRTFGNITVKEVTPTAYPIATGPGSPYPGYSNHNWLAEMLHRTVQDPWFHVRSKGTVEGKTTGKLLPATEPHPYDYATKPIANAGNYVTAGANNSHYFQNQTYDNRPLYKEVKVPKFDYDFWKAAAIGGRGQKGVYYLEWISGESYTNGLETKTFQEWVKTGPGFFFFETANKMNPQKGGPGKLVPGDSSPCGAKGVVYMNIESLKTTGADCGGENGWYNQPGEPYRDIGFRRVNEVGSGMKSFTTDAGGNYVRDKAYNNQWDFQDLPWSNGGSGKNEIFDVCVAQRKFVRESTATTVTEWVPLPYFPDCNVGNNVSTPGCNCSEPFEPYLNIHYDGKKENLQAYWDAPNVNTGAYPKVTDNEKPTGNPVSCNASSVSSKTGQERCATNAYDKRGALAMIDKSAGQQPIAIEGVVYNEGDYSSTGNAAYYGSVVVGGTVDPKGTQEIWYDACLASDCWPPKHIPFPRVMITSTQIQ